MARIQSLEGRDAGAIATALQWLYRRMLGQSLNPVKVLAHSPRPLLASFFSNALFGSGTWAVPKDLIYLVRIRAAARNGCPF